MQEEPSSSMASTKAIQGGKRSSYRAADAATCDCSVRVSLAPNVEATQAWRGKSDAVDCVLRAASCARF